MNIILKKITAIFLICFKLSIFSAAQINEISKNISELKNECVNLLGTCNELALNLKTSNKTTIESADVKLLINSCEDLKKNTTKIKSTIEKAKTKIKKSESLNNKAKSEQLSKNVSALEMQNIELESLINKITKKIQEITLNTTKSK